MFCFPISRTWLHLAVKLSLQLTQSLSVAVTLKLNVHVSVGVQLNNQLVELNDTQAGKDHVRVYVEIESQFVCVT